MKVSGSDTCAAYADPVLTGLRLFVIISKDDKVVDYEVVDNCDFTTTGTVSVSFRLGKDITYDVSAWADFGSQYYTVACDTYPKVTLVNQSIDGSSFEVSPSNLYDAYFAIDKATFSSDNDNVDLTLKRPFGLIKINTLDLDTPSISNIKPDEYKRVALDIPTSLDLLTSKVGDIEKVVATAGTNGSELSFEYIFASETATLYDFTYEYYSNNSFVTNRTFSNIPITRNYITNITGNVLTYGGNINVSTSQDWTMLEYIISVDDETTEDDLNAEITKALSYGTVTTVSLVGTMKSSELNFANSAMSNNSASTISKLDLGALQTTDDSGVITNTFNGDLLSTCYSVKNLYAPNIVGFTNGAGDAPFSGTGDMVSKSYDTGLDSLTIGLPNVVNTLDSKSENYGPQQNSLTGLADILVYLSLPKAEYLGDYCLNFWGKIQEIDLPNVTWIGKEVFQYNSSLVTLRLTSPNIVDPNLTGGWAPTNSTNMTLYLNYHMAATTNGFNVYGYDFKEVIYLDANGDPYVF